MEVGVSDLQQVMFSLHCQFNCTQNHCRNMFLCIPMMNFLEYEYGWYQHGLDPEINRKKKTSWTQVFILLPVWMQGPQASYPSVIKPSLSPPSMNKKVIPPKRLLINCCVTSKRKVTSIPYYNTKNFQCSAKTTSMQRKKYDPSFKKL